MCKAAEPGLGRAGPQSWPLSKHHPYPEPWAAPGLLSREQEMYGAWLGSQTHDSSPHSTILASKVFKEASGGAMRVVMVGEQAASPPTLSTPPAWIGTL